MVVCLVVRAGFVGLQVPFLHRRQIYFKIIIRLGSSEGGGGSGRRSAWPVRLQKSLGTFSVCISVLTGNNAVYKCHADEHGGKL